MSMFLSGLAPSFAGVELTLSKLKKYKGVLRELAKLKPLCRQGESIYRSKAIADFGEERESASKYVVVRHQKCRYIVREPRSTREIGNYKRLSVARLRLRSRAIST